MSGRGAKLVLLTTTIVVLLGIGVWLVADPVADGGDGTEAAPAADTTPTMAPSIDHLSVLPGAQADGIRSDLVQRRAEGLALVGNERAAVVVLADTTLPIEQRIPSEGLIEFDQAEVDALVTVVVDADDELVARHEAMFALAQAQPALAAELFAGILADADEVVDARAYAAQHLGMVAEGGTVAWVEGLLVHAFERDPELIVRREAFLALARVGALRVAHLLDDPFDSELAGMGDLVLAWWEERDLRHHADRIPQLLGEPDERILLGAAALAGAWRVTAARDALRALGEHPNPRLRNAAAIALRAMAEDPQLQASAAEPDARTTR